MLDNPFAMSGRTADHLDTPVSYNGVGKPSEVVALIACLTSDEVTSKCGSAVEITGAQVAR
jgi:hypothetical protein